MLTIFPGKLIHATSDKHDSVIDGAPAPALEEREACVASRRCVCGEDEHRAGEPSVPGAPSCAYTEFAKFSSIIECDLDNGYIQLRTNELSAARLARALRLSDYQDLQRVAVTEFLRGGRHETDVGAGVAPLWVRERAQAYPALQSVYMVGCTW
ncbi:hypothetical protein FA95DRAFT_333361 [Auriscalpium vulgare]|uniref:Uncharacterized protein n=1 Tax=Auriscalpium vulgare TaxID=40419 RepID=A0ACB8RIC0_9AGAM|nr:hypothetical protein FA95DRAFT_333361 [Auriscalpium vulgare]